MRPNRETSELQATLLKRSLYYIYPAPTPEVFFGLVVALAGGLNVVKFSSYGLQGR